MVVGATKECGGASAGWFELVGALCVVSSVLPCI
jgi:hypothetical protein